MLNNFEEAVEALNKYDKMTNKLYEVKIIGYRTCVESLATYTTVRLKELGLVTSVFNKRINLHNTSGNARVLWQILARNIRARIPYLTATDAEFFKIRNDYVTIRVDTTNPAVSRYLYRMARKLDAATNGTFKLTTTYDYEVDRAAWSLEARTSNGTHPDFNRIYGFRIIELAEDILQVLATLHREIIVRDNIIPNTCALIMPEARVATNEDVAAYDTF